VSRVRRPKSTIDRAVEGFVGHSLQLKGTLPWSEVVKSGATRTLSVNHYERGNATALAWFTSGAVRPESIVVIYGPRDSYITPIVSRLLAGIRFV